MPTRKSATPPKPEDTSTPPEVDPQTVKNAVELQQLARQNTQNLRQLVAQQEQLKQELQSLPPTGERVDKEDERALEISRQLAKVEDTIRQKQVRSGALLRRRKDFIQQQEQIQQQVRDEERQQQLKRFRIPHITSLRNDITTRLAELTEITRQAQFKATQPEQRDLARKLLALHRAGMAALEAFKRTPELTVSDEGD
jgi:small-conductance mechanosensitive channel